MLLVQLLQQLGKMKAGTYNTTLINTSLTVVTAQSSGTTGQTSLTVRAGNKTVAKIGEKVFLFTKYSNTLYLLTLTADLGKTTTCSFSSTDFDDFIPVGSVILMPQEGMFDKVNNTDLYFHQSIYLTAGTNGNDYLSAYGTSSFSVNSATTLGDGDSKPNRWGSQFGIFVAPYPCILKKIKGWASANTAVGDDAVITIWQTRPNAGSTSNLTINRVKAFTITSVNNQNHIFDLEDTPTENTTLAEGDIIFVSIRRTGTKAGGKSWYADIGFDIEMFKQPQ